MEVIVRKARPARNNVWKNVGAGNSDETAAARARERKIMFACTACGFLIASQYAERAHAARGETEAMERGMGCASKGCIRKREQYRRKLFIGTQLERVARLEAGEAILIAQPATRRPEQRVVLSDDTVRDTVMRVRSLPKWL